MARCKGPGAGPHRPCAAMRWGACRGSRRRLRPSRPTLSDPTQVMGLRALGIPGAALTSLSSKEQVRWRMCRQREGRPAGRLRGSRSPATGPLEAHDARVCAHPRLAKSACVSPRRQVADVYSGMEANTLRLLYVTPEKVSASKRFMAKLDKAHAVGVLGSQHAGMSEGLRLGNNQGARGAKGGGGRARGRGGGLGRGEKGCRVHEEARSGGEQTGRTRCGWRLGLRRGVGDAAEEAGTLRERASPAAAWCGRDGTNGCGHDPSEGLQG
jgi:hypothetical protein